MNWPKDSNGVEVPLRNHRDGSISAKLRLLFDDEYQASRGAPCLKVWQRDHLILKLREAMQDEAYWWGCFLDLNPDFTAKDLIPYLKGDRKFDVPQD